MEIAVAMDIARFFHHFFLFMSMFATIANLQISYAFFIHIRHPVGILAIKVIPSNNNNNKMDKKKGHRNSVRRCYCYCYTISNSLDIFFSPSSRNSTSFSRLFHRNSQREQEQKNPSFFRPK